jgi:hypothetical protein
MCRAAEELKLVAAISMSNVDTAILSAAEVRSECRFRHDLLGASGMFGRYASLQPIHG